MLVCVLRSLRGQGWLQLGIFHKGEVLDDGIFVGVGEIPGESCRLRCAAGEDSPDPLLRRTHL